MFIRKVSSLGPSFFFKWNIIYEHNMYVCIYWTPNKLKKLSIKILTTSRVHKLINMYFLHMCYGYSFWLHVFIFLVIVFGLQHPPSRQCQNYIRLCSKRSPIKVGITYKFNAQRRNLCSPCSSALIWNQFVWRGIMYGARFCS